MRSWLFIAALGLWCMGSVQAGCGDPSDAGSPGEKCAGNPINITNGNKFQQEVDMPALPGVLGLELVRYYNSSNSKGTTYPRNLGRGWTLSYESTLRLVGGRTGWSLEITQADGTVSTFVRTLRGGGVYQHSHDPLQGKVLVQPSPQGDEYVWVMPGASVAGGRRLTFDAQGHLVQIKAATGEFVSLQHDDKGHLLKVTDPQGRSLNLSYLEPQVARAQPKRFRGVQSIDTPVGRFMYEYGSPVLKDMVGDRAQVLSNLVKVTSPGIQLADASADTVAKAGVSRTYHYEDPRWPTLLTGISVGVAGAKAAKGASERINTWAYDDQGRGILSVKGDRTSNLEKVVLDYTKPGQTLLTNSLGQQTVYTHAVIEGQQRLLQAIGPGCPVCSPGNVRYGYDRLGRQIDVTRLSTQGRPLETIHHDFDGLGRLGQTSRVAYRNGKALPGQRQIRYEYEPIAPANPQAVPSNAPTLVAVPSVVPGQEHQVRMRYNTAGQVVQLTETGWVPSWLPSQWPQRVDRTTIHAYQRINGRSVTASIDGPLPGPADTTSYQWDDRADFMRQITYPLGLRRTFERDEASGRVIQEVAPDGVAIKHTYLPTGEDTSWQRGPARVEVTHDLLHRPTRIDLPDGEVRRLAYLGGTDAAALASSTGGARWVLPPSEAAFQMQASSMEAADAVTSMATDALHPPSTLDEVPSPWSGQRIVLDDFGRVVALHTDVSGWETRQYDNADHLIERRLADGTKWLWQRDALGRIARHEVSRAGAKTETTTLTYRGAHLVGIDHPNERERRAYDALGRMVSRTVLRARLGYTERFEYDAADRVTRQGLPEGGALNYTWGTGRQLRAIEHDDGRISAIAGERVSQWLGWGRHIVIEPLAGGPMTATGVAATVAVAASSPTTIQALLDKALQAEQGYRWGNGVELRWHLDQSGQLAGMRYVATSPSSGSWQQALLSWLPAANAANVVGTADASPVSGRPLIELAYSYDPLRRMSQRNEDGLSSQYGYDQGGRLLVVQAEQVKQVMPVKADAARAIASANPAEVEYYAYTEGRMLGSAIKGKTTDWRQAHTERNVSGLPGLITKEGVIRSLRYSADNRLIEVMEGGKLLGRYSHNTHGQRIGKTLSDGRTTGFLWSQGQLVGETLPSYTDMLARRYVYAHGVPVAVIDYEEGSPLQADDEAANDSAWHQARHWLQGAWRAISGHAIRLTYLHANEIGTPIAATNAKGQLIWRASYSAYGLIKAVSRPNDGSTKTFELNLRLPGQYFDAETGWHDNGLRTYDPQRGEYLEPDPLGPLPNIQAALLSRAQGRTAQPLTQPFAYANHNPLIYTDPTGLILFAFDGTGNSAPAPGVDDLSNVRKFFLAYDQTQNGRAWYMNGIGRDDPDSGIAGGVAQMVNGASGRERVDYMLRQLDDYMKNNTFAKGQMVNVDIVGFSRGAAMARDFANKVAQKITDRRYEDSKACGIELRFLGLWDTVAQFGLNGAGNGLWQLDVPASVKAVFHAVALNEHRDLFPSERISRGVERGFIGSHADIGGSYGTGDLSDVTLNWMVGNAKNGGIKMYEWGKNGTKVEWGVVTNPVLHDKSQPKKGAAEDRDVCLRENNEIWADKCQKQRQVAIGGKTWANTQATGLIQYDKTAHLDADGESRIVGKVNMQQYQAWLKSYGLEVPFQ